MLLSYVTFKRYRQTDRQTVPLYRNIPAAPHTITPEYINQKHGRRPGPAADRMCTPPHKVFRCRTEHTDDAKHTTPLLVLAFT